MFESFRAFFEECHHGPSFNDLFSYTLALFSFKSCIFLFILYTFEYFILRILNKIVIYYILIDLTDVLWITEFRYWFCFWKLCWILMIFLFILFYVHILTLGNRESMFHISYFHISSSIRVSLMNSKILSWFTLVEILLMISHYIPSPSYIVIYLIEISSPWLLKHKDLMERGPK